MRMARLASDILIFFEKERKVVLIKRLNPPYEGMWALPGGLVEENETFEEAATREAKEETNLDVELIDIVGVYSKPGRDPRADTVSACFYAKPIGGVLKAETDAKEVALFSIDNLPTLAFDHRDMIKDFRRKFLTK
ncbi:MAG: NUDIX hydrolase [Candidatus Korarchaeota archaeon]